MTFKYKTLLGVSNAKTSKGEDLGYLTGILYMAPSDMVEGLNLCPFSSDGCRKACLFTAGRGKFKNVEEARIKKSIFYRDHRKDFLLSLKKDILKLVGRAKRLNMIPCIRLNGTSDILWENQKIDGQTLFDIFPEVQFYDYTPNPYRTNLPENYHLTFSKKEDNDKDCDHVINTTDLNVAIVFDKIPEMYKGRKVINGDKHDLRFLDDNGVIVGLKAKGDARKDESGFVVRLDDTACY